MVFPDIFVNGVVLRQVDKQKYLGVMFLPGYPGLTKCQMCVKNGLLSPSYKLA